MSRVRAALRDHREREEFKRGYKAGLRFALGLIEGAEDSAANMKQLRSALRQKEGQS